jgi:cytochrome c5
MKKIAIFSVVALMAASSHGADEAVLAKYNQSCAVCHAAGVAGAPTTGSVELWAPRLEKGMDALVASVTAGVGAMPPKGMCNDCSAEDFQALIEYMSTAQ